MDSRQRMLTLLKRRLAIRTSTAVRGVNDFKPHCRIQGTLPESPLIESYILLKSMPSSRDPTVPDVHDCTMSGRPSANARDGMRPSLSTEFPEFRRQCISPIGRCPNSEHTFSLIRNIAVGAWEIAAYRIAS